MAYVPILPGDSLANSLDFIKARDDALRNWEFGPLAPTSPLPYQVWIDTTTNLIKRRNPANTAWIIMGDAAGTLYDGLVRRSDAFLNGNLNFNSNRGNNCLDPIASLDVANKQYVDQSQAGKFILSYGCIYNAQFSGRFQLQVLDRNVGFNVLNSGSPAFTNIIEVLNSGYYSISITGAKANAANASLFFQRILPAGPTNRLAAYDFAVGNPQTLGITRTLFLTALEQYVIAAIGTVFSGAAIDNAIEITYVRAT